MDNNSQQNAGQGMGIAALVLGIVAILVSFIPCVGIIAIVFGLLAIVFGAIGVSQARNNNVSAALPQAGFFLGVLSIAIVIIVMVFFVVKVSSNIKDKENNEDEFTEDFDSQNTDSVKVQDSLNT
ncbi:hypothetical protein KHA90_08460 [Flavobacterium psychroterrae]|uniref:DUF4190 domain-containing protein n=1 Tax=Flavobacterium psychroterrae TaxID=2133767 RepID=A0ABS5PB26_9FLAO|nr:DUF4190 domain-containing protein [Flavobacterium psychroterrae]MBS7231055.1 hypothetical protein [Flavobacterium psychroterrae]